MSRGGSTSRRRQTWRRALTSPGASVFLTVALVPVLLDQVQRIIGDVSPWTVSVALLIVGLMVLLFFFRREAKLNAAKRDHAVAARIVNESWIKSIVCTIPPINATKQNGQEATVQTLIRQLPTLRSVRVICSTTVDLGVETVALRAWAATLDRTVTIDAISLQINKDELKDGEIKQLSEELRSLAADGLVVDVTGGTKTMTLVAFEAAQEARLPVTYMIQRDNGYGGLSSLSDPHGVFEHEIGSDDA